MLGACARSRRGTLPHRANPPCYPLPTATAGPAGDQRAVLAWRLRAALNIHAGRATADHGSGFRAAGMTPRSGAASLHGPAPSPQHAASDSRGIARSPSARAIGFTASTPRRRRAASTSPRADRRAIALPPPRPPCHRKGAGGAAAVRASRHPAPPPAPRHGARPPPRAPPPATRSSARVRAAQGAEYVSASRNPGGPWQAGSLSTNLAIMITTPPRPEASSSRSR